MNISEDQYAEIIAGIKVLEHQQQSLMRQHESMFSRLREQDEILDDLRLKAEQGKGALWVLMSLGSLASMIVGFFVANAKSIIQWLSR